MAWQDIDNGLQIIIVVGGATGAATGIYMALSKVKRFFSGWWRSVEWLFSEEHDHKQIQASLDDIASQLTSNGGSSLKDALDRIEIKQDFFSAHMRTHLHTNSKAIFETDAEGDLIYCNKQYTRVMGLSAHEVKGTGWVNVIQPIHRERIVKLWGDAVRDRRDFDEVIPFIHSSGRKFDGHALAYIIRSSGGAMLGHIGEIIPE